MWTLAQGTICIAGEKGQVTLHVLSVVSATKPNETSYQWILKALAAPKQPDAVCRELTFETFVYVDTLCV